MDEPQAEQAKELLARRLTRMADGISSEYGHRLESLRWAETQDPGTDVALSIRVTDQVLEVQIPTTWLEEYAATLGRERRAIESRIRDRLDETIRNLPPRAPAHPGGIPERPLPGKEPPVDPLSIFGKFIAENLRDRAIGYYDGLSAGHRRAPALRHLQAELQSLDENARNVVRRCVITIIDAAIHDFLFSLQEQAEVGNRVEISVDSINVEKLSDGLHAEPYGPDGWMARFSRYGEPPEIP